MSKKSVYIIIVIVLIVALSLLTYSFFGNKDNSEGTTNVESSQSNKLNTQESDSTQPASEVTNSGKYITLSEFNNNQAQYESSKNVYFFHASWCPICRSIDHGLTNESIVPEGVTIVKVDFDTNTELRKKYGVTTQYTFVQVDSNGNEIAQWSATSSEKAIAGIKL
jgi:thiol-disulfide isomerase/thioredoxin